jgi:hypothetical protein
MNSSNGSVAVSYKYTEDIGRLGDQVMVYIKSRWAAYKYNLPFYFVPFVYSENLKLYNEFPHLTPELQQTFSQVESVVDIEKIKPCPEFDTLYMLEYGTISSNWHPCYTNKEWRFFESMLKEFKSNKAFFEQLKRSFTPISQLSIIKPPCNKISIAVHARTGGDYWYDVDTSNPHRYLRFLPNSYYAYQILNIVKFFKNKPLYIFIFTDDKEPEKLIEHYKTIVNHPSITWDYRKAGTNHDTFVLDDMFSMAQFDCLIRPWSQFSRLSEFFGNHKWVTYPIEHYIHNNKHIITYQMKNHLGKVVSTSANSFTF